MRILNLTSMLSFQSFKLYENYKDSKFLTISPLDDTKIKNNKSIKCEVGSLSYVLAMICQKIDSKEYFSSLDTGFLSGESNVSEEEIEEIVDFLSLCDLIIIDENVLTYHKDKENISTFLSIIVNKFNLKIINLENEIVSLKAHDLKELKDLDAFDGLIIFKHTKDRNFRGGSYFATISKIKDNDVVQIIGKTINEQRKFILDESMKGTIAFLGIEKLDSYSYEVIKVNKVLKCQ